MKTKLTYGIFITALFISMNMLSQNQNNTIQNLKDYIWRIEASGKLYNHKGIFNRKYKVVLFHFNTRIDSITVKGDNSFKFYLMSDEYYAIKVYKKGYKEDVISIWTVIPDTNSEGALPDRTFKTSLTKESDSNESRKNRKELALEITLSDKLKQPHDLAEDSALSKKESTSVDISIPKY